MSHLENDSVDEWWEHFSKNFGPTRMLLDNLPPEKAEEFSAAAREHYSRHVQPDGRIVDDREYLLVTGIRKSG